VVTIEDGALAGGFGSSVQERASEMGLRGRALSLGASDRILPHASRKELLAELGLTPEAIAATIRKELGR
jgi:1-deoxy-D-xylulose-5-phosphate synthase